MSSWHAWPPTRRPCWVRWCRPACSRRSCGPDRGRLVDIASMRARTEPGQACVALSVRTIFSHCVFLTHEDMFQACTDARHNIVDTGYVSASLLMEACLRRLPLTGASWQRLCLGNFRDSLGCAAGHLSDGHSRLRYAGYQSSVLQERFLGSCSPRRLR
ncbi:protein of unknown function (plasmid) [Rhodovastum atsumiense]|nr:protein of unknown function [Rhodovastum atsumiense]